MTTIAETVRALYKSCKIKSDHSGSDYFTLIRKLVVKREKEGEAWQRYIDQVYLLVMDEIITNMERPRELVTFGTSGWRGVLGKDLFVRSVSFVTAAIVELYQVLDEEQKLAPFLGVSSLQEARKKGCVVGFDNRFGGEVLAAAVIDVLIRAGFTVHYAGESTTGVLSAALLELGAAFSINLTPSHNPLEYGGFKYNAADAGPAASELTDRITANARRIIVADTSPLVSLTAPLLFPSQRTDIYPFDALVSWKALVRRNVSMHGLDLDKIMHGFKENHDLCVVIDSVHGASRLHVAPLFERNAGERLIHLRADVDVTFGGIAPEPSSVNMHQVVETLQARPERLKIGAIIDPDGDRIRFTDGSVEISMNQFGAMAYHFLHEIKGKRGMVAKTVATSNMANSLALALGEKVFEPKVGFKEFKPVIGQALVCFEESDGISVIGHTPEKDAYIGLLLAMDMVLTLDLNLGDYLKRIEDEYGAYYPDRGGLTVSAKGEELKAILLRLQKYGLGAVVKVGDVEQRIAEVIDVDGRKMIFEDGSWLMIRPSGTEPKVRFYVESRTAAGTGNLVQTARAMLKEIGLL
ncbi:MAG: phosphoglucomutase [Proteobacteria bacterium]|nr:phosphoglucomutase [Pseudomonadota bacterium]MBU1649198.1 phosphoglucomutase [Pseudomonadota bacterium]